MAFRTLNNTVIIDGFDRKESIKLIEFDSEDRDTASKTLIEMYDIGWKHCHHSHDCCGCWSSDVIAVTVSEYSNRAIVWCSHSANV